MKTRIVSYYLMLLMLVGVAFSSYVLARPSEHDWVREAVRQGEIIPLKQILEMVEEEFDGDILEIELDDHKGGFIYEIKVLNPNNRIMKVKIDAKTGRILKMKKR